MPTFAVPDTNGVGHAFRQGLVDGNGRPLSDISSGNQFAPERGQALPHVYQLSAMLGSNWKTYMTRRHDEAMRRGHEEANSMRRDAFLMGLLQERALGVSSLRWHIEVDNDRDPQQKAIKDGLTAILKTCPRLQQLFYYLEEETVWVGRGGSQVVWEWRDVPVPRVPVKSFGTGMMGNGGPLAGLGQDNGPPRKQPKGLYAGDPSGLETSEERGGKFGNQSFQDGKNAPQKFPGQVLGMNPAASEPEKRRSLCIRLHQPISGDSLVHTYDGTPALLVYQGAIKNLAGVEEVKTDLGRAIALKGTWRQRFILDSHQPMAAEFFDYERAEAIHGVGIRSIIYWMNWLRQEWLSNVADWCERTGLGVRLWYYQGGNPESKKQVAQAASDQDSKVNLLVPRYGDKALEGVDVVDTATGGADLLHRLMEYVDRMIERYVIGQSMSSGQDHDDGLGGTGRAKFAESTKKKIIAFDANCRADTITEDWLKLVLRWTYPDFHDLPVRFVFDCDEEDPKDFLESVKTFVELKGEVREDDVRGKLGLREPMAGDKVLKAQEPTLPPGFGPDKPPGEEKPEVPRGTNGEDAKPAQPEEERPVAKATPPVHYAKEDEGWIALGDDGMQFTDPRHEAQVADLTDKVETLDRQIIALEAEREAQRRADKAARYEKVEPPQPVNVHVGMEAIKYVAQTSADADRAKEEAERGKQEAERAEQAAAEADKVRYAAEETAAANQETLRQIAADIRADATESKQNARLAVDAAKQAGEALAALNRTAQQIAQASERSFASVAAKVDELAKLGARPRIRTAKKNGDGSVTITEE